jgi:hypothetical protein
MIDIASHLAYRQAGSDGPPRRRGTLVVCVVVCLLVATSLAAATTHAALRWRRSLRMEHQMRQTEFLLDAGILRAASQLRRFSDYRGETWRPRSSTVGFESPVVEIRVKASEDPQALHVDVVARMGNPLADLQRSNPSQTSRSYTFTFEAASDSQDTNS